MSDRLVLVDIVAHHHHLFDTFSLNLASDAVNADDAVDRLAARHGDRIVEENLVGHGGLGRDRLANGQITRVVVGAVAQVLKDMRHFGKTAVRHPVDTFAAHLDQAFCVAIHPRRHEMAADAGLRLGSFWHLGRGVMRTAGTKIGQTLDCVGDVGEQFGHHEIDHCMALIKAWVDICKPVGHQLDEARRSELAQCRDKRLPVAVEFAHDAWPHRVVVEHLLHLLLDERAFLFDHEHFAKTLTEVTHAVLFDRKTQAHLIDGDPG